MGLAALGMIFALLVGGTSLYYIIRSEFRAVRLIFGMAIVSAGYTLMAFIMAVVAAVGLSHTCQQFQGEGFNCATIFSGGFFETDTAQTYTKSVGTVQMAVASAWFCFASWAAYSALEFLNWRNSV
ncbi:hypothetical protein HK405_008411 [Cladochytrium tenue]|nr:hypothetical protein HK405_008411 [Cladochytrium tenue]